MVLGKRKFSVTMTKKKTKKRKSSQRDTKLGLKAQTEELKPR